MSNTNFPTSIDSITNPTSAQKLNNPSHSLQHGTVNDAVVALETKVGVDSSAVATTIDYLLKNTASSNPGHKHTFSSLSDFSVTSPSTNDLMQYNGTKWANQAGLFKFGGTGADGALNISSGTTTINLGNAAIVVKNYTSISITGSGNLAFSNPNTNGTIVILKSQGAVTVTTSSLFSIDMRSIGGGGGAGGTSGSGSAASANGAGGGGGSSLINNGVAGTTGATGGNGNSGSPGGISVPIIPGVLQTAGGGGSSGNTAGPAGTITAVNTAISTYYKVPVVCGSGGGGGAMGANGVSFESGFAGGAGGGALVIECAGALNITSTMNASGANGTASTNHGGSGGGGGGGSISIIYNTLTANSGTYTVTGGTGGTGGGGTGKDGGNGGLGSSKVVQNTEFA